MVYPYNGILCSHRKEWGPGTVLEYGWMNGASGGAIFCRALLMQHAQNKPIHKEEEGQRQEESEEDGSDCSEVRVLSWGQWIRTMTDTTLSADHAENDPVLKAEEK